MERAEREGEGNKGEVTLMIYYSTEPIFERNNVSGNNRDQKQDGNELKEIPCLSRKGNDPQNGDRSYPGRKPGR